MRITEKIRDKILTHLPKGYAATIASATGVSEMTVYRVLHHEQKNEKVALALIQLAHDAKKAARDQAKQVDKLIDQL